MPEKQGKCELSKRRCRVHDVEGMQYVVGRTYHVDLCSPL